MKKQLTKKLSLNKDTVANLNYEDMSFVYGGYVTDELTLCHTKCATDCPTCDLTVTIRTCPV